MTTLLVLAIIAILAYWLFWPLVAFIVSRAPVARWLIDRSLRTPYFHLDGYMMRWWLFNPIETYFGKKVPQYDWCPISIRIHHNHLIRLHIFGGIRQPDRNCFLVAEVAV